MTPSDWFAAATTFSWPVVTAASVYDAFQMGRLSLAYFSWIGLLVRNMMNFHASSGWVEFEVIPRPMEPFTAEAIEVPATPGAGTMPTLPETLLSFGSLASAFM